MRVFCKYSMHLRTRTINDLCPASQVPINQVAFVAASSRFYTSCWPACVPSFLSEVSVVRVRPNRAGYGVCDSRSCPGAGVDQGMALLEERCHPVPRPTAHVLCAWEDTRSRGRSLKEEAAWSGEGKSTSPMWIVYVPFTHHMHHAL